MFKTNLKIIDSFQCIALWPRQQFTRKMMRARYSGQMESSILFPFTETFEGFCKIDNEVISIVLEFLVSWHDFLHNNFRKLPHDCF